MIVNTVAPETTSSTESTQSIDGQIGPGVLPDLQQGEVKLGTLNVKVESGSGPTYRSVHSASVQLRMTRHDGTVVSLAQVGPDFAILPFNHGQIFSCSDDWTVEITIDGKVDAFPIKVTSDVDFSTERFTYSRIENTQDSGKLSISEAKDIVVTETDDKLAKERQFWEEVRLLGELRQCESIRDATESILDKLKERKKEIEIELRGIEERLPKVTKDVEDARAMSLLTAKSLWRLKSPAVIDSDVGRNQLSLDGAVTAPEPTAPAIEESVAWRAYSTAELLAGIKGLGKKKLEAIIELAPTLGDLEDLREQASKAFKQYHELLPQGCGESVAQMIEERQTKYIRDSAVNATGGNPLADELLKSVRQLAASDSWKASDCVPDSNDTEQTHLGYKAFGEGKPHSALPTQNPELARQWMIGWVCAEIIKHSPPEDAATTRPSQSPGDPENDASTDQSTASQDTQSDASASPPKKQRKALSTSKKSK